MIKLNSQQKQKIKEHTLKCFPEEMCGILLEDDFISLKNSSENPTEHFKISALSIAPYLKENIIAVVHSHCYNKSKPAILDVRTPTVKDIAEQKKSEIPWLITGTEGENVLETIQIPRERSQEYLNRPFIWFINDCYTLVQDYYYFELNITLPDASSTKDYKSSRNSNKPFQPYIKEYGFSETTDITNMQNGDLILIDNGLASENHLGIYHENNILIQEDLSIKIPFTNFIGRIHKVLKYDNM